MNNVHLYPSPFSMDDTYLFETFLLAFSRDTPLKGKGTYLGRESVEINPILDGNADNHKIEAQSSKLKAQKDLLPWPLV